MRRASRDTSNRIYTREKTRPCVSKPHRTSRSPSAISRSKDLLLGSDRQRLEHHADVVDSELRAGQDVLGISDDAPREAELGGVNVRGRGVQEAADVPLGIDVLGGEV